MTEATRRSSTWYHEPAANSRPPRRRHAGCRACSGPLEPLLDLGAAPVTAALLRRTELTRAERFQPRRLCLCPRCLLLQIGGRDGLAAATGPETPGTRSAAAIESLIDTLGLPPRARVIEAGSGDGQRLERLARSGRPVIGIESVAAAARLAMAKGVPTLLKSLDPACAAELTAAGCGADLLVVNQPLAETADLDGLLAATARLLTPDGVAIIALGDTLPVGGGIEDIRLGATIRPSLLALERLFLRHALRIFEVDSPSPGQPQYWVHACHANAPRATSAITVAAAQVREIAAGLDQVDGYHRLAALAHRRKRHVLEIVLDAKRRGETVAAYGTPALAAGLLCFWGIRSDLLDGLIDPAAQEAGGYLPGSHVPVFPAERLTETRPAQVLVLDPAAPQAADLAGIAAWGGRAVSSWPLRLDLDSGGSGT